MSRPTDWSPLGLSADPTPGDPAVVSALSQRYGNTAAAIADQATKLRALAANSESSLQGKTGSALRSRAGDLGDHIDKAKARYEAASTALKSFATEMSHPQEAAVWALGVARDAQATLSTTTPLPAPAQGAPPLTPAEQSTRDARARAHSAAADALASAQSIAGTAASEYQQAAKKAHDAIHDAIQHDGVHDSWWDRHAGWIKNALKWIGVAILVLAVIAILITTFGAAGGILAFAGALAEWTAAGLTAVSLVGHWGLAASGNGKWSDVAFDAIGLASFGLGKFFVKGIAALAGRLPTVGRAAANAETLARTVAAERSAATSLRSSGLPGWLYRAAGNDGLIWLGNKVFPGLTKAMPAAETAAADARAAITLTKSAPKLFRVLGEGERETARSLQALRELNAQVPGVLRNKLRATMAFLSTSTHASADLAVATYATIDLIKQFHVEPQDEARLDRQLDVILQRYEVATGQVP